MVMTARRADVRLTEPYGDHMSQITIDVVLQIADEFGEHADKLEREALDPKLLPTAQREKLSKALTWRAAAAVVRRRAEEGR